MLPAAYTDPVVGAYYLATRGSRLRALEARVEGQAAPVMVLFYHRVADSHPNDWTISTQRFKDQIEWVRQRYEIISLVDVQERIGSRKNRMPAAAITFDDGYRDNGRTALPWLVDQRIPFTYFVATRHIFDGAPFAHDVEQGQPLEPNTPEEVTALAAAGVEIGSHTCSHANIGALTTKEQIEAEIVAPKRELESLTGKPVRYFAFPFGLPPHMSRAGFEAAFQAGYWGVCSAYGGYNLPGDDPFHIQRIHGDPGWGRFCNWMTVDPRKLRRRVAYNPGDYRSKF